MKTSSSASTTSSSSKQRPSTPNPSSECDQSTTSEHLGIPNPTSGCDQPSTSELPVVPVTTSAAITSTTSTPSQGITAAAATLKTMRCMTPTITSGMDSCLVSAFQLSTVTPPVDGPILYVSTQLAGSTQTIQSQLGFKSPQGSVSSLDLEVAVTGAFTGSPLQIHLL